MIKARQNKGKGFLLAVFVAVVTSHQASAPAANAATALPSATMMAFLHVPSIQPQQTTPTPAPGSSKSSAVPLPDGDGMALTKKLCSGCHGTDTFARQRHERAKWDQILDNMVSKGMEASDDDLDKVASYLNTHFGPKSVPPEPPNPPPSTSAQPSANTR